MKKITYKIYVSLFAKKRHLRFNRFIITLGLKGLGINNYETRSLSGEENFSNWFKSKYKNGATIFDVGANEGDYTQMFLDEKNTIFNFEPVLKTFNRLSKRYSNSKNVTCNNIGLSDKKEKLNIYDKKDSGTSHASLHYEAIGKQEELSTSEITLSTVDFFCAENNISHIDLLKIDTEGHEFSVLKGAKEMLSSKSIDIIHFEFNTHNIFVGKFLNDFRKVLCDYDLFRLLPNEFMPISTDRPEMEEFFFFQNIIAIRKNLNSF